MGNRFVYEGTNPTNVMLINANYSGAASPAIISGNSSEADCYKNSLPPISSVSSEMRFGPNELRYPSGAIANYAGNSGSTGAFSANTSVVSHGMEYTPDAGDISVTPIALGGSTQWYVDNITSTQFTINVVGTISNANYAWQVNRLG